jgi:hypothetical protein
MSESMTIASPRVPSLAPRRWRSARPRAAGPPGRPARRSARSPCGPRNPTRRSRCSRAPPRCERRHCRRRHEARSTSALEPEAERRHAGGRRDPSRFTSSRRRRTPARRATRTRACNERWPAHHAHTGEVEPGRGRGRAHSAVGDRPDRHGAGAVGVGVDLIKRRCMRRSASRTSCSRPAAHSARPAAKPSILTLRDDQIDEITAFVTPETFQRFGLAESKWKDLRAPRRLVVRFRVVGAGERDWATGSRALPVVRCECVRPLTPA